MAVVRALPTLLVSPDGIEAADPAIEPSIRLRTAIALTEAPLKTPAEEQQERYSEMEQMRAAWECDHEDHEMQ